MVNTSHPDFSWIPFFKEMGKIMYEYSSEEKRNEFSDKVFQVVDQVFERKPKLPTKFSPFSAMALINRGNKVEFRVKICEAFHDIFSMNNDVPSNFYGVPMVRSDSWWFIIEHNNHVKLPDDEIERSWNLLWENYKVLYQSFYENKDEKGANDAITKLLQTKGMAIAYLSMFLFWIDSDNFMTFDGNVIRYLDGKINIPIIKKHKRNNIKTGDQYLQSIKMMRTDNRFSDFVKVSYESYEYNKKNEMPALDISIEQWESLFNADIFTKDFIEILKQISNYEEPEYSIKDLCETSKTVSMNSQELLNDIKSNGKEVRKKLKLKTNWDGCAFFDATKTNNRSWEINYILKMSRNLIDYLDTIDDSVDSEGEVKKPLNLILYGPPGTGKTYSTREKAVEIILGKKISDNGLTKEEYDLQVKKEYYHLVEKNRIGFVTFHQSYGYEQFIEGIFPVVDDNDGSISYEVKPGVFKSFCENALSNDTLKKYGISDNPTIWKISLKGSGDNDIRKDCLKNNHIRIGYGDDLTINDKTDFKSIPNGDIINRFVNEMSIGDIVLSCYSNRTIDAIGVIRGDFKTTKNQNYKQCRDVEWIKKFEDEKYDITSLNGSQLAPLTIYKLNRIAKNDISDILSNVDTGIKSKENKRYVFIIDEINRGNISRIFGELITAIEESKRKGNKDEIEITLPYSKKPFSVPNNVYILGTMNTADRSLIALDSALRRRFHFEEMMPDSDLVKDKVIDGIDIKTLMETINRRIVALYDREHQIGHSYFMHVETLDDLKEVFLTNIIPLLQEYFHEDYSRIIKVLSKFDDSKKSDFIEYVDNKDVFHDGTIVSGTYKINIEKLSDPSIYTGLYE